MGKIHNVEKMTDNRFVNLYHVDATSVHNTPVSYYVASRAKDVPALKLKTGRNDPDGVIIYSIYGEKKDKVVLVRQYRYTLGDYIYEFPAGLVEPGEDFHEGAVREMYEETGLKLEPLKVDPAFEKPYFTTVGMTDESCATVYGYASGEISKACLLYTSSSASCCTSWQIPMLYVLSSALSAANTLTPPMPTTIVAYS